MHYGLRALCHQKTRKVVDWFVFKRLTVVANRNKPVQIAEMIEFLAGEISVTFVSGSQVQRGHHQDIFQGGAPSPAKIKGFSFCTAMLKKLNCLQIFGF